MPAQSYPPESDPVATALVEALDVRVEALEEGGGVVEETDPIAGPALAAHEALTTGAHNLTALLGAKAAAADLTAHVNDATDAHDASAISVTPSGPLTDTTAQAALETLSLAVESGSAEDIAFTPAGAITADDVQGAIEQAASLGGSGIVLPDPAPARPAGAGAVAVPAGGTLPAGDYYYWVAALYADSYVGGPLSDWNAAGAAITITTASTGAITLSCDDTPDAIGYRWYGGPDGWGEMFWDTEDPEFTDTGVADGGATYATTGATFIDHGAVPYALAMRGTEYWSGQSSWTVPAGTDPWIPFTEQRSASTGAIEFVPVDGGTPAHLHFLLPGVYVVGLRAKAPDASSWGLMCGFIGDIFGGGAGLFEDYHSGYAVANQVGASGVPEILMRKTFVTLGADDDAWRVSARLRNQNGTDRSVGLVDMSAIAVRL